MFEEYEEKLEGFYDMPDSESKAFLSELNTKINQEPEKFIQYINNLEYDIDSPRPIFYEALNQSNSARWSDFIFKELQLLIETAEKGLEKALDELSDVSWLTDIQGMNIDFYLQTKSYLFTKLKSPNAEIRELCLSAIFDVLGHLQEKPNSEEIAQLQNCLKDSNLKNKVYAYSDLKEAKLLPKGFKFSTLEKMKIRLKGYSSFLD
jgi:hypothetical protein